QCGRQAGGALCPGGLCCSQYGWCGNTDPFCDKDCQSQCGGGSVASIISSSLFEQMLKHRNDAACPGKGFYTYTAFIAAANSFSGFGTTGDDTARKREIAAFLAQTSHETTGNSYSSQGSNYNYGPAGRAIGSDLLNNPDLVATDATISFKTALWFWMTPQSPKPSCHDVITGSWTPSNADRAAGRLPGYGVTTNIINGGLECGKGYDARVADRIGFYKRYCDLLGNPHIYIYIYIYYFPCSLDVQHKSGNPNKGGGKLAEAEETFHRSALLLVIFTLASSLGAFAEQCGRQAGGALCPGGLCCSQFGWCGNTDPYCGEGCQSQCGGSGGGSVASIISSSLFEQMLKHRNDAACPGKGFYTYNAFIAAANSFSGFGTTGNDATKKREIAAFLAQTSHETTGNSYISRGS
ncbi:unnamed protein product, partial [Musa acuminata subsp. burmannicoides]